MKSNLKRFLELNKSCQEVSQMINLVKIDNNRILRIEINKNYGICGLQLLDSNGQVLDLPYNFLSTFQGQQANSSRVINNIINSL